MPLIYGPHTPTLQIKGKVRGGSGSFSLSGISGTRVPSCRRGMEATPHVSFSRDALFFDASINQRFRIESAGCGGQTRLANVAITDQLEMQ